MCFCCPVAVITLYFVFRNRASFQTSEELTMTADPENVAGEGTHLLKHSASSGHESGHGSIRRLHESVPSYANPMQRQRWDDVQML